MKMQILIKYTNKLCITDINILKVTTGLDVKMLIKA